MCDVIQFPINKRNPEDLEQRCRAALAELVEVAARGGMQGFAVVFQQRNGQRKALLAGICEDEPDIAVDLTERLLGSI